MCGGPEANISLGQSLQPLLGLPRPQMTSLNFSVTLLPFWMETANSVITISFTHSAHLEVTGTHPTFVLLDVHQITPLLWLCLEYFCLRGLKMNGSVCYYSFTGPLNITPSKNIKILHCNLHPRNYICTSFSSKRTGFTFCSNVGFFSWENLSETSPTHMLYLPWSICLYSLFLTNVETNWILWVFSRCHQINAACQLINCTLHWTDC